MRNLKILGLALVAMAALTALVGTSSAMAAATKLCKANESACSAGNTYASGTEIEGVTKTTPTFTETVAAKLATNLGNVLCDSSVKGKTTAASGEPLPGTVTALSFTNCSITIGENKTTCTVTTKHLPYTSNIVATTGGNGTLNVTAGTSGSPGAKVECAAVINCEFEKVPVELPLTGGAVMEANAEANAVPLTIVAGGSKCPTSAKWTGKYFLALPTTSVFATH